jgi:Na+-translocating ferredoxin:NAD+ oxidoreductase RnfC subunit
MCPRYLIGHQMRPHRVMRALGTGTGATDLLDALLCCECGICELYACPMGLSPRRMNIHVKNLLRADGVTRPVPGIHPDNTREREYRRIAQSRFIDRWQLGRYPTQLDNLVRLEPDRVVLAMRHGVGQPARPGVTVGDAVTTGQVVGQVAPGEVGALVHASIDGVVTAVTEQAVEITGALK